MAETTELRDFVSAHHVHFDVGPDETFVGKERVKVGFVVRLWAVHKKGARALPGCPKCSELVSGLRRLASFVCPHEFRPTIAELSPFDRGLYDSREVEGADEVDVTIRLAHRDNSTASIDPCEKRCLDEIRTNLKALGARER